MSILNNKAIFITGASRSGTTMLNRIFGKHSKIFGLNELHVFGDLVQTDQLSDCLSIQEQVELARKIILREKYNVYHANKKLEDNDPQLSSLRERLSTDSTTAEVFLQIATTLIEKSGKTIPCEQTPRNIFYAKQLLEAFPEAHIVHIVRDPRSVLASQKSKWRLKFLDGDHIPWLDIIRMWCNYHPVTLTKLWVEANRTAKSLSNHPHFHLVKFEELLASPQAILTKLCSAMDLAYEDNMLDISHEGSSHQLIAGEAKGISNTTQDSWKKSLTSAEIHLSQKGCSEVMRDFGYEDIANTSSLIDLALVWCRFPLHILGVVLFNPRRAKIQLMSLLAKFKA